MPDLPGGGAELSLVIGYGMTEDRRAGAPDARAALVQPGLAPGAARERACCGTGMHETQVLTGQVRPLAGHAQRRTGGQSVELGRFDMFSVPAGSWRRFELLEAGDDAATAGTGELLVVNSGDGRVRLEWAPEVIEAAFDAGWMLDPNGYLAPVAVMVTATEDD